MNDEKLICVIGDAEQTTGFLLAGVGQTDARGSNFLVVDASACAGRGPRLLGRRGAWDRTWGQRLASCWGAGAPARARRRLDVTSRARAELMHSCYAAPSDRHAPPPPPSPPAPQRRRGKPS